MNSGRRDFFKTVGTAAAAAAAAAPALIPATGMAATSKGDKIGYGYVHGLVLEGAPAGLLQSFEGGDIVGVVQKEPTTEFGVVPKHIGGLYIDDILISVGGNMSPVLLQWVQQMLGRNPQTRSGAVVSADFNFKPRTQMNFTNALISEVVFPALDASAKGAAAINLRLVPELTRHSEAPAGFQSPDSRKPKSLLTSNFRLTIGGIDPVVTQRVTKIEAITVKQNVLPVSALEARTARTRDVEPLDVGSIVFTIPEKFAQPFFDWHFNFVVEGNGQNETSLSIEYMDPSFKQVLGSLQFQGVGIVRASYRTEDSGKGGSRLVEVELYAEQVLFTLGKPVES